MGETFNSSKINKYLNKKKTLVFNVFAQLKIHKIINFFHEFIIIIVLYGCLILLFIFLLLNILSTKLIIN